MDFDAYAPLLHACADARALAEGKQVHAHMLLTGINQSGILWTRLVNMYAVCGSFGDAQRVLNKIPKLNVFCFNAMIRSYVEHGQCEEALKLYYHMPRAGVQPDNYTFPYVIKACTELLDLQQGIEIHDCIIGKGFESNVFVGNALLDMYCKCGYIEDADQVFDEMPERDVVSWTTLIAGYVQNRQANEALKLFRQMQWGDVKPNSVTIASVLPACALLAALQQGKEIHDYVLKRGFESDVFVGSALVDMYAKCGRIEFARHVFDKMPQRNVVSWNGMIAGYTQNGHAEEAVELFHQMQLSGIKPNSIAIVSVLPACAQLASLQKGKEIHDYIMRRGFESVTFVGNALIDMYAKCGSIVFARQVFDKLSRKDVASWTAMIAGYGMHGHGEEAVTLFNRMQLSGVNPNHITVTAVLSACSHAGLVREGQEYFNKISQDYHDILTAKHYACMVDLLGRAGRLDDAHDFIKKMPIEPGPNVWGALLGACKIHRNIELGEYVAERFLEPSLHIFFLSRNMLTPFSIKVDKDLQPKQTWTGLEVESFMAFGKRNMQDYCNQ
eukprot:Gb_23085 [translate_table: standard]